MKFFARIKDIGRTLNGTFTIILESPSLDVKEVERLSALERLDVEIEKHKKRRSRDANAYYWKLVGKIANITGDSRNRIHNIMLNRKGELDQMPDGSLISMCIRDDIDYLEFLHPHLKPTQKTIVEDGKLYRWYYQIKGSSEYNTAEMSALIDEIVNECKGLGIETLTPAELERMMAAYDKKHHTKG